MINSQKLSCMAPGSKPVAPTVLKKKRFYHCVVKGTTGTGKTDILINKIKELKI